MKHEHHPFENQIFNHYRINKKKIKEAIKFCKNMDTQFLKSKNYLTSE